MKSKCDSIVIVFCFCQLINIVPTALQFPNRIGILQRQEGKLCIYVHELVHGLIDECRLIFKMKRWVKDRNKCSMWMWVYAKYSAHSSPFTTARFTVSNCGHYFGQVHWDRLPPVWKIIRELGFCHGLRRRLRSCSRSKIYCTTSHKRFWRIGTKHCPEESFFLECEFVGCTVYDAIIECVITK